MARRSSNRVQEWPLETQSFRSRILVYVNDILPMIEVCLSEGIIKQRYLVIEMLLPSIEDYALDILEIAKVIRRSANGRGGRPPRWIEATEESIALASKVVSYIREIKSEIRRNGWGPIATYFKVCMSAMNDIEDQLESVEAETVPIAFREAFDEEMPDSRWRSGRNR